MNTVITSTARTVGSCQAARAPAARLAITDAGAGPGTPPTCGPRPIVTTSPTAYSAATAAMQAVGHHAAPRAQQHHRRRAGKGREPDHERRFGELKRQPCEDDEIHPARGVEAEPGEPQPAVGILAENLGEGGAGRWRADPRSDAAHVLWDSTEGGARAIPTRPAERTRVRARRRAPVDAVRDRASRTPGARPRATP